MSYSNLHPPGRTNPRGSLAAVSTEQGKVRLASPQRRNVRETAIAEFLRIFAKLESEPNTILTPAQDRLMSRMIRLGAREYDKTMERYGIS